MRDYTETAEHKRRQLLRRLETANENDAPKIVLAVNLLRLRMERGRSQYETARALGVDTKNYCQWERGEIAPSLRYLLALAQYLETTVDGLLTPPQ